MVEVAASRNTSPVMIPDGRAQDGRELVPGALQGYGIEPGPGLMTEQPELVWALLASLLVGNALLLVLNLPLAPAWAKLLRIPRPQL